MEPEPFELLALPPALQCRVLALAPVDARARCACASRGMHALLADPSLWRRLDLSDTSGVTCHVGDAALRNVAARAGGALQTLNLTRLRTSSFVSLTELLAVATSNAGTLRELCLGYVQLKAVSGTRFTSALLRAAPRLRILKTALACDVQQVLPLLRNFPPYEPLQLHRLHLKPIAGESADASVASIVAVAAALSSQTSLRNLALIGVRLKRSVACNALALALVKLPLVSLEFYACIFGRQFAFALAWLLGQCKLSVLVLSTKASGRQAEPVTPLLSQPASCVKLADALWENRTLTCLHIDMDMSSEHLPELTLLSALVRHPTLRTLDCKCSTAPATRNATGAAVGALIAADAPALTALSFSGFVGTDGLGVLCAALPRNTHLRCLDLKDVQMDEACAAEHLLPAVTANRSLHYLTVDGDVGSAPITAAIELVNKRAAADAAAAGA